MAKYLNYIYQKKIFIIILQNIKIRYFELKLKIINATLLFVVNDPNTLITNLKSQIKKNLLTKKINMEEHFIYFFISSVLKFNSK